MTLTMHDAETMVRTAYEQSSTPFADYLKARHGMTLNQFERLPREEKEGILICWASRMGVTLGLERSEWLGGQDDNRGYQMLGYLLAVLLAAAVIGVLWWIGVPTFCRFVLWLKGVRL